MPKDARMVSVRVRPNELRAYDAAARWAGLGRSEWLRRALRDAAEAELLRARLGPDVSDRLDKLSAAVNALQDERR